MKHTVATILTHADACLLLRALFKYGTGVTDAADRAAITTLEAKLERTERNTRPERKAK